MLNWLTEAQLCAQLRLVRVTAKAAAAAAGAKHSMAQQ